MVTGTARARLRIPTWLKILGVLTGLSLLFSILGAISEALIPTGTLWLTVMLFPGKDVKNPRLFKVVPWLWGAGFLAALLLLTADYMGRNLVGAGVRLPTRTELWMTIIFSPALIWTFIKRKPLFRTLLVVSSVTFIGISCVGYYAGPQNTKALIELVGDLSAELLLATYLYVKYMPKS